MFITHLKSASPVDNMKTFKVFKDLTLNGDVNWDEVCNKLLENKKKYNSVRREDTTWATDKQTFKKAMASKKAYLADMTPTTIEDNPMFQIFDNAKVFREAFAKYEEQIQSHLNIRSPLEKVSTVPIWANGKFRSVTTLHFDDYHNFVVVLKGCKIFYLSKPNDVSRRDGEKGYPNESEAIPDCLQEKDFPPLLSERGRKHCNKVESIRVELTQGQMLYIPPRWWHYVVSEEETIMVNFWFNDIAKTKSINCRLVGSSLVRTR